MPILSRQKNQPGTRTFRDVDFKRWRNGEVHVHCQRGFRRERSGDTINIDAGTYKAQDILLTKNLTIEAAGNGPVVLEQSSPLAKGMLIAGSNVYAPNITIQGLTFTGATSPSQNGTGIRYQSGKSDSEQRHVQ